MEIQKSHVMDWVLEDTSDCELVNYSQWRSEATTPGGSSHVSSTFYRPIAFYWSIRRPFSIS